MMTRRQLEDAVKKLQAKVEKNPVEVRKVSGSKAELEQRVSELESDLEEEYQYGEDLRKGLQEVVDKVGELADEYLEDDGESGE